MWVKTSLILTMEDFMVGNISVSFKYILPERINDLIRETLYYHKNVMPSTTTKPLKRQWHSVETGMLWRSTTFREVNWKIFPLHKSWTCVITAHIVNKLLQRSIARRLDEQNLSVLHKKHQPHQTLKRLTMCSPMAMKRQMLLQIICRLRWSKLPLLSYCGSKLRF